MVPNLFLRIQLALRLRHEEQCQAQFLSFGFDEIRRMCTVVVDDDNGTTRIDALTDTFHPLHHGFLAGILPQDVAAVLPAVGDSPKECDRMTSSWLQLQLEWLGLMHPYSAHFLPTTTKQKVMRCI